MCVLILHTKSSESFERISWRQSCSSGVDENVVEFDVKNVVENVVELDVKDVAENVTFFGGEKGGENVSKEDGIVVLRVVSCDAKNDVVKSSSPDCVAVDVEILFFCWQQLFMFSCNFRSFTKFTLLHFDLALDVRLVCKYIGQRLWSCGQCTSLLPRRS